MSDPDLEDSIYGAPGAPPPLPRQPDEGSAPEPPTEPEEPAQAPPETQERAKAFPERWRERLTGLMFLGRLEEDVEWLGHKFVIRTRTAGEQIEAGIVMQPAVGTRVEMKAWQAATVAAGLSSVDGGPLIVPLNINVEVSLRERYEYILKNWYPPTIDVLYQRILALEVEARELVDAMGEAFGQGTTTPG